MKLLENNNRKFMKNLSGSCLKANKSRNGIAVLAIILTAVLFMGLTTVMEGTQVSMKNQMLRQAGSRFMVSLKGLSKEEAETLAKDSVFSEAGVEHYVANVNNQELRNIHALAGWVDETTAKNSFMELTEGHYPKKENEIACDTEILKLLGVSPKPGSTVTLQYSIGEEKLEKKMTLCGVWEGRSHEQNASLLISKGLAEKMETKGESYSVRGSFHSDKNIQERLDNLIEKMGYDPEAKQGEEGYLIHHVSPAYEQSTQQSPQTIILIGIGILLILFAGYLVIYNIFKISVEKDIRLYGQLKTIGTSPKQIRYMIIRQGSILSLVGIPAGLVLGWLLGNGLLPLVMASTNFAETEFIVPSWWIWLLAALFTFVTVRIRCSRPGKIAGRISPVEALKYQSGVQNKQTHRRGKETRFPLGAMAVANLSRNKGKTLLVVLSLSFSAVLLNCALNYTGNMDEKTFVEGMVISDIDVRSRDFLKPGTEEYKKVVKGSAVRELENLEGVQDFGKVYTYMLPEEKRTEKREDLGKILRVNGKETSENSQVFERNRMLYGYNENALARAAVIEGTMDYEKLCSGDYVVMAGSLGDSGEYNYEAQEFHAGDIIEAEIKGTVKEYTVLAVVGVEQAQEMSYSSGGYEAIAFPESVFLQMFPEMQNPIHCLFDAKEGSFDTLYEKVEKIAEGNNLSVLTRLTAEAEFKEIKTTFSMVGIVVSVILGSIGTLNLVNVILTGVIARQREFAAMRSIGMTKKQLRKLMICEGVLYAVLAGMMGLFISAILSMTLVKGITAGIWYMKYHFTLVPALVVFGISLFLSVCISAMTDKIWNKRSVVELLRAE